MVKAYKRPITKRMVEARWGMSFWDLLKDIHSQDLTKKQAAAVIGMTYDSLTAILTLHREKNPWVSYGVVKQYMEDTGEHFGDALRRMAALGYTYAQASAEIGFTPQKNGGGSSALAYAMKIRGIDVKFVNCRAKRKPKEPKVVKPKPVKKVKVPKAKRAMHPWKEAAITSYAAHLARTTK